MAIVNRNIVTEGLQGKVGNLVFRRRGKKTTAYVMSSRKAPLTEKQRKAQIRFAAAVALAKAALSDETERKKFEELAKIEGKESAYSSAVSYFMNQQ